MTTVGVTTRLIGGLCALGLVVCGCDRSDTASTDREDQARETTPSQASSEEHAADDRETEGTSAGADLSIGSDVVWTARVGAPGTEGRVRIECASAGLDEEGVRRLAKLVGSGAGDKGPVPYAPEAISSGGSSSVRRVPVPYDAEAMPGPFRGVAEVEVLTPEGPRRLALARLERTVTVGAYYWLQTERAERLSGSYWTVAAPVGTLPAEASIRTPEPRPLPTDGLPAVREALLAGLDRTPGRAKIEEALQADDVRVVDGEFPEPYAQFVTVNLFGREAPPVRAAFLAGADGSVEVTVEKPTPEVVGPVHLPALVDLNGDDREGVLFEVGDHGYTLRWLHFDASGRPQLETPSHFASGG